MVGEAEAVATLESKCREEFKRLEKRIDAVNMLANTNKLEAEAVCADLTLKVAEITRRFDTRVATLVAQQTEFEKEIRRAIRPWYVKLYQWVLPHTS